MTIISKNYNHLKGKPLECIIEEDAVWQANGEKKASGFVANIDFNVGISIKCLDTQKDLICLNKADADAGKYKCSYEERFNNLVNYIESGVYYAVSKPAFFDFSDSSNCAFEGK